MSQSCIVLLFYSSISFKISKILLHFGFKISFRLVNKLKLSFAKDLILTENQRVASTLFHLFLVILVILDKQEDSWKLGWMNIIVKLKMKRFMPHPLHLIFGLQIIILILLRLAQYLLQFPLLILIFIKFLHFEKF